MRKVFLLSLCWLLYAVSPCQGRETVLVACAANFAAPLEELAAVFEARTSIHVDVVMGSTGLLYSQIQQGAAYDLFLAADMDRPAMLHESGRAERPVVYAVGSVVLWSVRPVEAEDWKDMLALSVGSVAMANPTTAPYGASALAALEAAGLDGPLADRMVYGKNVGQAFQFVWSGAANMGFVALSQALSDKGREGFHLPVDEGPPVEQGACLLGGNPAGREFLNFLLTDPEARELVARYGYA